MQLREIDISTNKGSSYLIIPGQTADGIVVKTSTWHAVRRLDLC